MKRILLVILQVVVSAELTLQLLGFTAPHWRSRAGKLPTASDAVTILCVGDSHTYGAPLPAAESYPAQLQARLDARPGQTYRVVNLGVPGINSAMIANRFEDHLVRYRPDLVILWAGGNNRWNENETESWGEAGAPSWARRALLRVKLVRWVRFLRSRVALAGNGRAELLHWEKGHSTTWRLGDELIEIRREGPDSVRVSSERAGEGARKDLTRMVETARAYGLPILLVTYPYEQFGWVNDATRSVARELDVEVLETFADLARARAAGYTRGELIVMAAGPHPRGVLHGYIAESMADRVLALLASN